MSAPSGHYLVRMTDRRATEVPAVGAKFAALARAAAAGLPVPPAFAVDVRAFSEHRGRGVPDSLALELRAEAHRLGLDTGFAVRSSAVREDLEDGSFAGVYSTLLHVAVDDLPAAVEQCWEAADAGSAHAYLERRGEEVGAAGLALIVQRMIEPRAAGVAFSRNPVRRDVDEVVVEAVSGLGDAVASGERTPWRAFVGANGAPLRLESPLTGGALDAPLDEEAWRRVADLARRAERHAEGRAQDIEWALDGRSQLWLLQLRPITTGGGLVEAPAGSWTRALAVDLWADRVSAYLGDVLLQNAPRWDLSAAGRRLGLKPPGATLAIIGGFLYVSVAALEAALALLPRRLRVAELRELLPPGADLEALPAPGFGALAAAAVGALRLGLVQPLANPLFSRALARRGLARHRRRAATLVATGDTPADLLALVERATAAFVDLQIGNQFPYAFAATSVWLLRSLARTLGRMEAGEYLRLLGGGGRNVSVAIEAELRRLAATPGDPPPGFAEFLERYGCRAPQRDLAARRWAETPDEVLAMLRGFTRPASEGNDANPSRLAAADPLANVAWPARSILRLLRREARRYLDLREDLRFALDEALWVLRRALLELGARFGLGDLLIHLRRDEVADLVAGRLAVETARERATVRRHDFFSAAAAPRWVIDGHPVEGLPDSCEGDAVVRGVGISPGRAAGRVRVVRDPARSELQVGEVLVAKHLDPGWTPILGRAAGLVVEEGGLLNHAAIIAREFGIPAVVGVRNATQRWADGTSLVVDGSLGLVMVADSPSPDEAAAPPARGARAGRAAPSTGRMTEP